MPLNELPDDVLREVVLRVPRSQVNPLRACNRRLYAMCCSLLPCASIPWASLAHDNASTYFQLVALLLPAKLQHLTSLTLVDESGRGMDRRAQLARLLWLKANAPQLHAKLQHLSLRGVWAPLPVLRAMMPDAGLRMRALRRVDLGDVQGGGLVAAICTALCEAPALSHLRFTSPELKLDLSPLAGLPRLRRLDFASTLTCLEEGSTEVSGARLFQLTRLDLNISPEWQDPFEEENVDRQRLPAKLLGDVQCMSGLRSLELSGMNMCDDDVEDEEDVFASSDGAGAQLFQHIKHLTRLTRLVLDAGLHMLGHGIRDSAALSPFGALLQLRVLCCWLELPLSAIRHLHSLRALKVSVLRRGSLRLCCDSPCVWDALPSLRLLMLRADNLCDFDTCVKSEAGSLERMQLAGHGEEACRIWESYEADQEDP